MSNLDDLERFLDEVDSTVDSIQLKKDFPNTFGSRLPDPRPENTVESMLSINNGRAVITVSQDGMRAVADFFPPSGSGKPLSLQEFEEEIEALNIKAGIIWPWVKRALQRVVLDRRPLKEVTIAEGRIPQDVLPDRWEILPSLLEERRHQESMASIDFKTLSPFQFVKQEDPLAEIFPPVDGYQGHDVFGNEIPFHRPPKSSPEPGENIVQDGKFFKAACDGCFYCEENRFWVSKVLVLPEGVSYKTGNVDFSGDVVIQGEVAAGFTVRSGGAIYSSQVVDVTEVTAIGDIATQFGFIGHPGSVVTSHGRIRATYAENVVLTAKGSVEITRSLVNCFVQTHQRFVMGPRGMVVGGRIQAQDSIDLFQAGTELAGKAELICGIDFEALEKIMWIRDQTIKMVELKSKISLEKKRHAADLPKLLAIEEKLSRQIYALSEEADTLVAQIDRNERAEIVVRGTVHPGNYLEICHVSFLIPKKMSRVRFFLNKTKGQIGYSQL